MFLQMPLNKLNVISPLYINDRKRFSDRKGFHTLNVDVFQIGHIFNNPSTTVVADDLFACKGRLLLSIIISSTC